MKFWDTSAIIPLLANEPTRELLLAILDDDPEVIAWWGTPVEIASALARRERENVIDAPQVEASMATARALSGTLTGATGTFSGRFDAVRLMKGLQDYKITNMSAAATHYRMMKNSGKAGDFKFFLLADTSPVLVGPCVRAAIG